MTTFITVLQVIACLVLIAGVLLQQPKGGGTVFGGSSQSVFGSSGGTTFMFRLTMWTAIFIMASSLFLAWYRISEAGNTVVNSNISLPAGTTAPAIPSTTEAQTTAPATSATPAPGSTAPETVPAADAPKK